MMGLDCGGCESGGNSSSLTSNLSALAPPFTVDRLNPKPNSNSLLNYPESPYGVEPFSHAWEYANPSAPRPELDIHSTRTTNLPLSDDYGFSTSMSISPSHTHWSTFSRVSKTSGNAFAYGGEVEPYYPAYVPPMVGEDSPLIKDISSQIDYTQSVFDRDYGWMDGLEFDDGKQSKRVGLDGSFSSERASVGGSHIYKNHVKEAGCGVEFGNKSGENSGVSYGKFNRVSDREVHSGSLNVGCLEDKSCHEQNLSFLASSSTYPESHTLGLSHEMHKNFFNFQNSCIPYEKCVGPIDSSFTSSVSVTRSSPTVVIRPPPAAHDILRQSNVSRKPAHSENVAGGHSVYFDHSNPSKQKDPGLKRSSEIKEGSFDTKFSNFSKQGNDPIFLSSSPVKELSSPPHTDGTFDGKIKARFVTQLPDINVSGGLTMVCDSVQVVNSVEDSSDLMDHHNPAVDSPCWKGAPSSQCSAFDIEAGSSHHFERNLDENYGFNSEKHQNFQSLDVSTGAFSMEAGQGNKNDESKYVRNSVVLPLESTLDANCPSKEQSLSDDAKAGVKVSTLRISKGVQIGNSLKMPRKESGFPNNLNSGFDMKISDAKHFISEEDVGMTLNDASEGGAVAFHAAEKVLASPSSQEDATEHVKLQPDSKNDVQIMIKAIHNLSELLLSHISRDVCVLEEENTGDLKHIISNLDACMSKKIVHPTNKQEPINPIGGITEKLVETRYMGSVASMPYVAANSGVQLDYQHMHEEERNYKFSGKKAENVPVFSPSRDDVDLTIDDGMAKAIKKVLEENFHFNEEMQSQAILFKSLWLEAEAKLCSISYKAHFDRMKIEMEKTKPKFPKVSENKDAEEMMSKVRISPDPNMVSKLTPKAQDVVISKPTIQNSSMCIMSQHVDDKDASIMARFNILKAREDNSKSIIMKDERPPEITDNEFAGNRMRTGHQSDDKTLNVAALKPYFGQQTSLLDKEGNFSSYVIDPAMPSFTNNRIVNQQYSGLRDTSSSDWEHVLKDDFAWKNL